MTSTVLVKRVHDLGLGKEIPDTGDIVFVPGNFSYPEHDEAYGTRPDFNCNDKRVDVGESTTCTVAFTAPAKEIQNSYWYINGLDVAA